MWCAVARAVQADWNIVKRGWEAHVLGKAPHKFTDALTAVKTLRVRHATQRLPEHLCAPHDPEVF